MKDKLRFVGSSNEFSFYVLDGLARPADPYRYQRAWPGGFLPRDWQEPKWDEREKCHCWRNHVTTEVRSLWPGFTDAQKKAIAFMAEGLADNEEWR